MQATFQGDADEVARQIDYSHMVNTSILAYNDETALTQIKEKKYIQALEGYEGEILLVGIHYEKEDKKHTCVIERV